MALALPGSAGFARAVHIKPGPVHRLAQCSKLPKSGACGWKGLLAGVVAGSRARGREARGLAQARAQRKPKVLLPPLDEGVWKPEAVGEEELSSAEVSREEPQQVAEEVWGGRSVLFTRSWADVVETRKALNALAKRRLVGESSAALRERRKVLRDCTRRMFLRSSGEGRLLLKGGPVLGYVPVLYESSTLTLRANDATALHVAWQYFLNGLSYPFLKGRLHPFFGVYFTPSPIEHFQLLHRWLEAKGKALARRALDLGTGCGVVSFLLRELLPDCEIVASDLCPNACFSVTAELLRRKAQGIEVRRSDLFDDLEGPFDLIVFNPPWVPRLSAHPKPAAAGDVVGGNDYPAELFPRLFEDAPKVLAPNGHLVILFSNYALCRGLVEESPLSAFAESSPWLRLEEVRTAPVEQKARSRSRQTRRDKAWGHNAHEAPGGAALGFREKSRRARDENEDVSNRGGREGSLLLVTAPGSHAPPVSPVSASAYTGCWLRSPPRSFARLAHKVIGKLRQSLAIEAPMLVFQAGELCCKHWLAVQVARRCGVGVSSTSLLGEDEFLEWTQQRMLGCHVCT
ncbi:unnamed protein product [Effrenium voratum]|uniref:Methyltransferase small domain-containing protein n=1 Tax=Effrenium voratum TaxID=2562239 RepID=A0AA36N3A0_9DINO|nr:unnamed protein product [Effrenium voratum]